MPTAFTRCEINLSKCKRTLMSKLHGIGIHRATVRFYSTCVTDPSIHINEQIIEKGINHHISHDVINYWQKQKIFRWLF